MNILDQIAQEAQELINLGNSKDAEYGEGMKATLERLSKYYHGYYEVMKYFDSISDEEKPKLHRKLSKLGL
jgi:hypothetical protein